ncbi:hypothetical protein SPSIL_014730 [Sporomusa silvacetica DSM 10669]|uniref:Peptidoglycan binding-like domain-containing protein n=1 Tax=Sporomusa silvacetica DSM 10669 TaxID=1123289 RepID=A0ABZ3IIX7_9FIRM|nr:peptidoglycan-binding protein [Sporomusa silvacetica]OZC21535.1 autolytic lysozyme [Sporomusa silvacetica DSM 10669]
MKKRLSILLMATTLIVATLPLSFTNAHPGRTDSSGGHYVRTSGWGYPVGSYHYHNGGPARPSKNKPADIADIKLVQQRLNELGYDCGEADGIKGEKTEQAIKNFQSDKGLESDGIVGPKTKEALGL